MIRSAVHTLLSSYTVYGPVLGPDPFWDETRVLFNFNGTNGSTVFTDSSQYNVVPTRGGTVSISTAQKQYGSASLGVLTAGYLGLSTTDIPSPGTSDFCIEAWVYPTTTGGSSGVFQFFSGQNTPLASYTNVVSLLQDSGAWYIGRNGTYTSINCPTWQNSTKHLAVQRKSGVLSVFVNGFPTYTVADTSDYNRGGGVIGQYYTGSYSWNGYIDDFRYTSAARYPEYGFYPAAAELSQTEQLDVIGKPYTGADLPVTSGLLSWLDASDADTLTLYGAAVMSWADKADPERTWTPLTGAGYNVPVAKDDQLNHRAVDFGFSQKAAYGASKVISMAESSGDGTVFLAYLNNRQDGTYSFGLQRGLQAGTGSLQYGTNIPYATVYSEHIQQSSAAGQYSYTSSPFSGYFGTRRAVVTMVLASTSANMQHRLDGAPLPKDTMAGNTASANNYYDLIGSNDSYYDVAGVLGEMLVYNRRLNDTEIKQVESYLLNKWSYLEDEVQYGLELLGDGTAGSAGVVDTSPVPVSVTSLNGAVLASVPEAFGGSAIQFPTSSAYLSLTARSAGGAFDIGTSDFTISLFCNYSDISGSPKPIYLGGELYIYINTAGNVGYFVYNSADQGGSFLVGQRNHIICSRYNGRMFLGLNGTAAVNGAVRTGSVSNPSVIRLNRDGGTTSGGPGWVDTVQVFKGRALYHGGNYTIPTGPLTDTL